MSYFKEFKKNLDFYMSQVIDIPLARPHWIYVSLSHKCNFNCRMCVVKKLLPGHELETEVLKKALDEISGWKNDSVMVLTGGEPFLREDIFEIIAYAHSKGIKIEAVSNASPIDEGLSEEIVNSGLDNIAVSLDGSTASTHDSIRNYQGAFSSALNAIRLLKRAKQIHAAKVQISVWSTIMKDNLSELSSIIPLAQEAGAECIVYHPLIAEQANMRRSKKAGPSWIYEQDLELLRSQIEEIEAYRKNNGLVAFQHDPHLFLKYFNNTLTMDEWRCNPFIFINIGPNADVSCCGEPSFGNLHSQTLQECLNSASAHRARNRMKSCRTPCLQTCWARPEADSLEAIVSVFLEVLEQDVRRPRQEKRLLLSKAVAKMNNYELMLKKDIRQWKKN